MVRLSVASIGAPMITSLSHFMGTCTLLGTQGCSSTSILSTSWVHTPADIVPNSPITASSSKTCKNHQTSSPIPQRMQRTTGVSLEALLASLISRRLNAATRDTNVLGSRRKGDPGALHPMTGEQAAESTSALSRIDAHKERATGDGGVEEPRSGVSGTIAVKSRIVVQDEDRRVTAGVGASIAVARIEAVSGLMLSVSVLVRSLAVPWALSRAKVSADRSFSSRISGITAVDPRVNSNEGGACISVVVGAFEMLVLTEAACCNCWVVHYSTSLSKKTTHTCDSG